MKTMNWMLLLTLTVAGFADAKTWAERKAEAKTKMALTDTNLMAALDAFGTQMINLKNSREAHMDQTAENGVMAEHAVDGVRKIAAKLESVDLSESK
ncbi:MAG: hypothetical protein V4534_01935 [Myxococcota bacterium]